MYYYPRLSFAHNFTIDQGGGLRGFIWTPNAESFDFITTSGFARVGMKYERVIYNKPHKGKLGNLSEFAD